MRRHCGDEAALCEECCTKIRRKAEGSKRTDTKNAPHGASNAGTVRGTRERRKIGQGANRVDFPRIVVV